MPDLVGLFRLGNGMGLGLGVARIEQIEQKVACVHPLKYLRAMSPLRLPSPPEIRPLVS